jgi:hypothetical protein
MELSYITKKGEGSFFDDNLFRDIDKSHINCYSYFRMSAFTKLLNKIEDDIEMIHYYQAHLDNFNKFNDLIKKKLELKEINEKYLLDVQFMEAEFLSLFKDLEDLQSLSKDYEEIFEIKKRVIDEDCIKESEVNDDGDDQDSENNEENFKQEESNNENDYE